MFVLFLCVPLLLLILSKLVLAELCGGLACSSVVLYCIVSFPLPAARPVVCAFAVCIAVIAQYQSVLTTWQCRGESPGIVPSTRGDL